MTPPSRMAKSLHQPAGGDKKTPQKFLVPLLTPRQKLELGVLGLLWMISIVLFWGWWLHPDHVTETTRYVLESLILAWLSLCPLYFLLIFYFGKVPNPAIAVPRDHRVAMVVTKAPSEPFEVARETMEAMLSQTYKHDTWLADEDPQPETIAWCQAHGVHISTRKGRTDYHRATWPRRTRCKEGNLAFFYDHYGYANYDFVSQLDADHVPEPTYLEEMLRPFADPHVGYVSAASICDKNAPESWSARSRLYVEAPMHGAMQAGYTNALAPLCIGSHYAVRTAALQEVGGLGPELAEDHSTTLFMAAHGWRGVHAINAIAHGAGPTTFGDMITQEFQWSRSLVTLLLQYTPQLIGRLPLRLKFQFLFCQCWYPLLALTSLALFVIPIVALLFDINMAAVSYADFVVHAAPPALILTALIVRLAGYGYCRPADTKVLSWEGALYPLIRWPWVLIGTAMAVRDWLTGAAVDFRVTPKGASSQAALPIGTVMPFAAVAIGSTLPVILLGDIQNARGFYLIALLNGLFYTVLIVVIFVLHSRENRIPDGLSKPAGKSTSDKTALQWSAVLASVVLTPLIGLSFRLETGFSAIVEGSEYIIPSDGWARWLLFSCGLLVAIRILQRLLPWLEQGLIGVAGMLADTVVRLVGFGRDAWTARSADAARQAVQDRVQRAMPFAHRFNRRVENVADLLIAWKAVDSQVLSASLKAERKTGIPLGRILARRGAVDVETFAKAVSVHADLPRVSLSAESVAANADLLSQDICIRHSVFPAGYDRDGQLVLAVATPLNAAAMQEIAAVAGKTVVQQIARASEITAGLRFLRGAKLSFSQERDLDVPLLGELLIEQGHIKPAAFHAAMKQYNSSVDGRLGDYLVQLGIVTRAAVHDALSAQRRMWMAAA